MTMLDLVLGAAFLVMMATNTADALSSPAIRQSPQKKALTMEEDFELTRRVIKFQEDVEMTREVIAEFIQKELTMEDRIQQSETALDGASVEQN